MFASVPEPFFFAYVDLLFKPPIGYVREPQILKGRFGSDKPYNQIELSEYHKMMLVGCATRIAIHFFYNLNVLSRTYNRAQPDHYASMALASKLDLLSEPHLQISHIHIPNKRF